MQKRPPTPVGRTLSIPRVCYSVLACLLSVLFFSCANKLDRASYIDWVRDVENGLHVKKEFSQFVFDLQYQPHEYRILQAGSALSHENAQNLKSGTQTQYFTLTISLKEGAADFIDHDVRNIQDQQQKLYYFSYLFQNDITLEENGATLPCVLYHFERASAQKNSRTFVLGFENPSSTSEDVKLVINSEHFSSLPIKIKVSKNNIPSLAL